MTIVINTKTYTADAAVSKDQIPYIGPASTLAIKDRLDLYRTPPKASTVYSGNARSRAKLSRTVPLTGAKTTTGDIIADLNITVPVGAASADVDAAVADILGIPLATVKTLAKNLSITY